MRSSEIYSIFGQIEAAAAEVLIKDNQARKIPLGEFPKFAPVQNDQGDRALFAVLVYGEYVDRFSDLIADLRA